MTTEKRHCLLVSAALVLVLLAVYWQVGGFDWVIIDDGDYAKDNPHIRSGLTVENLKWVATASVGANWHPVTIISHMLDNTLYGSRPGMHHLTNVFIHMVNTLLLFGLLLRLTTKAAANPKLQDSRSVWACGVVTAWFALHPLRAESVAWISERKDVLSAFFFLLTLWCYVVYTESRENSKNRREATVFYIASLVSLALGLMSKAMLVTVPCVLLLLDYWPLRRIREFNMRTLWPLIIDKIPFSILSAAFCFITFFVQKHSGTVVGLSTFPFSARLGNAIVSYSRYLGMTFWPVDLAAFYPYQVWASWQIAAALALFVSISAVAVINIRKRPYLFVGWFFFTGMLVPVIGLSQVGTQAMADRYTYMPHIGLFMAIVWLAFESLPKLKPAVLGSCGFLLALACVPLTYAQVSIWRNSETMIRTTLSRTTNNAEANFFMGGTKQMEEKFEEAMPYYQEALRLRPNMLEAWCGLGNIYDKLGRRDLAAEQYAHALQLDPTFPLALHCSADVLRKNGKADEAIATYYQTLKYKPNIPEAHYYIATLLETKNDWKGAIEHFREAIRLNPYYADAMNNLAWALATQKDDSLRNGPQAARLAAQAVSLREGPDAGYLDTLAAALAEEGKFNEAVQTASTAMTLAQSSGDTNLVTEIESRRRLYQSQRAYRE